VKWDSRSTFVPYSIKERNHGYADCSDTRTSKKERSSRWLRRPYGLSLVHEQGYQDTDIKAITLGVWLSHTVELYAR